MRFLTILLSFASLGMSGCAIVPYAPAPAYYGASQQYGPPIIGYAQSCGCPPYAPYGAYGVIQGYAPIYANPGIVFNLRVQR
jgi:hypothetical protein